MNRNITEILKRNILITLLKLLTWTNGIILQTNLNKRPRCGVSEKTINNAAKNNFEKYQIAALIVNLRKTQNFT